MNSTKHALPGYDKISAQLEDAAHRGTSFSPASCQMLLETAESYAQEVQKLHAANQAMEALLLEVIVHLRIQAHFSKEARQSLIERAEKALNNG
jgi:hypothetical protein